jgi:hypothetical protein
MQVHAANYYVDYAGGSNTAAGTSPAAAFKNSPGDPAATGNASRTLVAGDTVFFKGGVSYKGKLNINVNGNSTSPIVYKGDGWGTDKAIIDCSEPLTGWTQCASAADAGGNSNWANIWYTTSIPSGVTALEANLYQADSLLQCAQYPNLKDIFWMDDRSTYVTSSTISKTSLTYDSLKFMGSSLTRGYVYLDVSGNNVDVVNITAFDSSARTISFSSGNTPLAKFAIANCLSGVVFDKAGEYVYDETARKMYLWPWSGTAPNTVTITVSVRQEVAQFNGSDYVTFEGFQVLKCAGKSSYANGNINLTIRDCDYHYGRSKDIDNSLDLVNQTNLLVEGCTFFRNARMRGVVARRSGSTLANCVVRNCSFVNIGRTGIFLYEVNGGEISGNFVKDGKGVHSNGLSCYSDNATTNPCRNVLIKNNASLNSNNCLTFYGVDSLTIINNLFDGTGDWPVSCWNSANSYRVTMYHNHFVNSGANRCGFFALPDGSANMPTCIIRNNIIDGMPDYHGTISHNLYCMLAVGQYMTGVGDIRQTNKTLVFNNYTRGDYTLKAGSPAIDAGTTVGVLEDLNGVARPQNGVPDMGCYETLPVGINDYHDNQGLKIGGIIIPNPVQAMAGAVIVRKAILEKDAGQVTLHTMVGQPINDLSSLQPGFYLLQDGKQMRKIVVTE